MASKEDMYGEITDFIESHAWVFEACGFDDDQIYRYIWPNGERPYPEVREIYSFIFTRFMKAVESYKQAAKYKTAVGLMAEQIRDVWKTRPNLRR